jgi:hypothetical protein
MLTESLVARLSAGIACLACVCVAFEGRLPNRPALRRGFSVCTAVCAALLYFAPFVWTRGQLFHDWEMFHYVLGAKYAPELGYERLYTCVAVAEATELAGAAGDARAEIAARSLRDLRNDGVLSGTEVLRAPKACTDHFSPQRWAAFKQDVGFFRRVVDNPERWQSMQLDHGYNPSPVWTLVGRVLASARPLDEAYLKRLAWLDPVLMLAAVSALGWAFGARAAWLACIFWSTQAASSFMWTGGAFLRQDWLTLAILALCFLRKRQGFAAGACLAWSALLRVFPLLFFAGPAVIAGARLLGRRQRPMQLQRFWLGAACAGLVLLSATALFGASARTYRDFAAHLYMHARTPIANHMSLRTLIAFDPSESFARLSRQGDPDLVTWPAAQRARLERRRPLQLACVLTYCLLFLYCVRRLRTPWIVIGLSFPLVVVLTDPSAYYYSMVVLTVPLARARRSVEVLLLGLAACSQLLLLNIKHIDERYVALSALYLAFGAALLAVFSRPLRLQP